MQGPIPDFLKKKVTEKGRQNGLIKAWSFSALSVFETCPYQTKIERVDKIRMPSGPAAERGQEVHDYCEGFVNGSHDKQSAEMSKHFETEFNELRDLYNTGCVSLEGDWGFDTDWTPVDWMADNIWARIKLDAFVKEDDKSARVIDYKTGKRWGNEMKHGMQGQLYAIAAFLLHPELEYIETEFWYLDKGGVLRNSYTRAQAMMFLENWELRATKMTNCTTFKPMPSKHNCRWCKFKEMENPETGKVYCPYGVL